MAGQCVSCGGTLAACDMPYRYGKSQFQILLPGLEILICTTCGLRQVDHSRIDSDQLDAYYASAYRPAGKRHRIDPLNVPFQARGQAFARLAMRYAGPSRIDSIYELGAGLGYNLLALKKAFPAAALYAHEADETADMPSEIQSRSLDERRYDIVLLSHVLEHLLNPADWLKRIDAALEPGALLIIEVPNDTENFLLQKPEDQPHILFFERATLSAFVRAHLPGYEVLHLATAGPQRVALSNAPESLGAKARFAAALSRWFPPAFHLLRAYSRLKQRLSFRKRLEAATQALLNDTADDSCQHLRLIARKPGCAHG